MIEFAAILFLKRMHDVRAERKYEVNCEDGPRGSFKIQEFSAKIDGFSLIAFSLAFITFNTCYWIA